MWPQTPGLSASNIRRRITNDDAELTANLEGLNQNPWVAVAAGEREVVQFRFAIMLPRDDVIEVKRKFGE
jgi:hypothetical protein